MEFFSTVVCSVILNVSSRLSSVVDIKCCVVNVFSIVAVCVV